MATESAAFDKDVVDLQNYMQQRLSRVDKIVKTEVKVVDETKLDYFTKYLSISRAIYYDVFEHLEFAQNPFNRFASSKIIFEHRDDVTSSEQSRKHAPRLSFVFSPEKIKGRLKVELAAIGRAMKAPTNPTKLP